VTADALRSWCLAKPGVTEEFPFSEGVSVFKIAGKMFALSSLEGRPLQVSVKCDPDLAVGLRRAHPAIRPGYHLNKRHWNTVTLDGSLADEAIAQMVEDSYDLVVAGLPRRTREAILKS
jgi:predicted DNA-binding protein (MmcQ/YjbR family)